MNECKILTFNNVNYKGRLLKNIQGDYNSILEMKDYPTIEQEINAYLKLGYKIQSISNTHHNTLTVVLVI